MFINNRGNSSGIQGGWNSSSTQSVSFNSFSFSASVFSSQALNGLNQSCGREPQNAALQTLSSLFSAMSLLNAFQGLGGRCGTPPPPCHKPPSPCPPAPQPPRGGPCHDPRPPQQPGPAQQGQMWDVFFDARSGTKTVQQSPLVMDLNGNGQADITGGNITGNGKLEGTTVKGFDLNLQDRQWASKSVNRRPGHNAPDMGSVSAQVIDKNGKVVKQLSTAQVDALKKNKSAWNKEGGDMGLGLGADMHAEFRDANGKLVGELKRDGTNQNKLMYFWDNSNQNEWTQPWDAAKGGDGMLVWDADGDGKITSGKELFGHVDLDGKNTFKNGYEKLAHYFDRDRDGVVKGAELQGLKIWEDRNGDGITQDGELVELSKHGVSQLNTGFNASDMSSTYGKAPVPTSLPSVETSFGAQGASSQNDLRQSWQVFQMVEVMRLMQLYGMGQG
jgi:hypothetical protein